MNRTFKKAVSSAISAAMILSALVIPETVGAQEFTPIFEGDTVLNEWKFDFGTADNVMEGYTPVTPDRNYTEAGDYGFIGTNEKDYLLGDRLDGFNQQQGQVIQLETGGSGENDGIGSVGEDDYGNAGEKYYPVRFALKADDETYYRVRATVTTLDPSKDATASLYTERKHPLYTEKTIKAGETETTEFTVRVTPIYYQKSTPSGAIADGMVNVCVLGENTALASLEIQQVETAPVLWVLGDSTVTDGGGTLPFFPLQNYTGVGTGLTKYIPGSVAMVNEGEGGLNAADSLHFNMVSTRIKAGDYMYVEYGHNHKDDGAPGYLSCLDKYYDACHSVGANLIIVSPIERINAFSDGAYQHTLRDFATTGESYVSEKVAAGATDIAYVDLNQHSLDFYNKIVADNDNSADAIKFYFQTAKGGGTDTTHPNDAGAENLAYCFIEAAREVEDTAQKAVLSELLSDTRGELPNLVSEEVVAGGLAGDAWPTYNPPVQYEYPIVIKDVALDENNQFTTLTAYAQAAFSNYASGVLEIYNEDGTLDETYVTRDHVDNTTGTGTNVLNFNEGIILKEGQTYKAYMWSCYLDKEELIPEEDGGEKLSADYVPTDIEEYILPGENGGTEDFDFYGKTALTDNEKYIYGGSAGKDLTLGTDAEGVTYTRIMSDGAKNGAANQGSFYIMRPLENLEDGTGSSGRYMINADFKYVSGGGVSFAFAQATTPTKSPFVSGQFTAFTIGDGGTVKVSGEEAGMISGTAWTNVKYILDMNAGTAEVSVAGGTPVTVNVPEYQTFSVPAIDTLRHFIIEGQKVAFDINVSNLTVAKLKDNGAQTTLTVAADNGAAAEEPEKDAILVNADKDYADAVLIIAEYDADNALKSAKITSAPVKAGENSVEYDAEPGAKVMLWDGADTMKPLADAVTVTEKAAEPTAEPSVMGKAYIGEAGVTEKTVAQSSIVTAEAVPEEGYVFVEWVDDNGARFSTDSEINVRLYKDLALTAKFAKQGGVEDTASYKIAADKTLVKAGNAETITLTLEDVFDAAGNPVKYSDSDASWSCDDSAVSVSGGVVTIPADYQLDGSTKDITVTCTLNNISNSVVITVYSYEFFEDVSGGETTAAWDGDIMTIGGRNCVAFPGGGKTYTMTIPEPVLIGEGRTLSYKASWSGANTCGQPRYIEIYDSNGNKVVNDVIGYSWTAMTVGGTLGGSAISNGTNFADALVKDTWNGDVVITIGSDGTGKVEFGGASADITINTEATDIASIRFISATGAPDYTQRAIGITDITIK